jgi:hypothetical protein
VLIVSALPIPHFSYELNGKEGKKEKGKGERKTFLIAENGH